MDSKVRKQFKKLMDEGRYIEAGWVSIMLSTAPPEIGETQLAMVRHSFFAGARVAIEIMARMTEDTADEVGQNLASELAMHEREVSEIARKYRGPTH